ncbi:MAG TPA: efflux RND transporter permease subunit [Azospirillum sp.]
MKAPNLSEWAIRHPVVVQFLMLAVLVGGVFSYLLLGRAEDPSFSVKTMIVRLDWPGATAREMADLVADPLEKRLQELGNLDYVKTYARPGTAVMQVQLRHDVRGRDVGDAWYQVRKKLTDSRRELPDGVLGPVFDDEYGDVYSALYMISGDGLSNAELKRYAEAVRKVLLRVENVAKVSLVGDLAQRIYLEFSHAKLAALGIPPTDIFDAVRRQNAMLAAGSVETDADRIHLRVGGAANDEAGLAAVPVQGEGRSFRLGDIARISRGYEDPPSFLVRHAGRVAVGVAVVMADGGNVLKLGGDLKEAVARLRADLPLGVRLEQVADQPQVVEESVGEFLRAFAEALATVLFVTFLSLGLRAGAVVALSVPIVLGAVFIVMHMAGMNLDRITLGALIIALGLLVDDAIIAVETMMVKMQQGVERARAATFAWTSTAMPMLTGTLVTAAGFLPVGLARSVAGEYAGHIFTVVTLALVVSWIVAVIVTPYLGVKLLPDGGGHGGAQGAGPAGRDPYATRPYQALRAMVAWSVRRRGAVLALTVAALGAAGFGMGFVQQQFFPASPRLELFIEIRTPEGSGIGATDRAARKAEALLARDPDVATFVTYVGRGSPRFFLALNPILPNDNFAQTVILTRSIEARERLRAKLERAFADGAVPEARVRVDRLVFGPPVGFPVQFRVVGPDAAALRDIARKVRDVMRANPRTVDAHLDWHEQAKRIRLEIDQDRARAFGLDNALIARTLQSMLSGLPVAEHREGSELVGIVARAVPAERLNLDQLPDLTIRAPGGASVPLAQVARLAYDFEEPIVWRRDRNLELTVRSDVVPGVQAPTVTGEILPALEPLKAALPDGYRIDVGGAAEESDKANAALVTVFPAMILATLTLLVVHLQCFSRVALVLLTAPLGIIGTVAALLAFDAAFGFVAVLGVIALGGMIMRNTIILMDQISHDLDAGVEPYEAVVESTVRRARPVVLTALAAVLAMVPLTRSVFWGPMAMSIMGGLIGATLLSLFVLPALYAAWFRVRVPEPAAWAGAAAVAPSPAPSR